MQTVGLALQGIIVESVNQLVSQQKMNGCGRPQLIHLWKWPHDQICGQLFNFFLFLTQSQVIGRFSLKAWLQYKSTYQSALGFQHSGLQQRLESRLPHAKCKQYVLTRGKAAEFDFKRLSEMGLWTIINHVVWSEYVRFIFIAFLWITYSFMVHYTPDMEHGEG